MIIPKSVHKSRMEENIAIGDFELDHANMEKIAGMDKKCPSILDCSKTSAIDRLYDFSEQSGTDKNLERSINGIQCW